MPYELAMKVTIDIKGNPWGFFIDVVVSLIAIVDIYLRSKLGYSVNERGESVIQTNLAIAQQYYINNLLITDLLATFPFDMFLIPFVPGAFDYQVILFLRTLKLFKIVRILELIQIIK